MNGQDQTQSGAHAVPAHEDTRADTSALREAATGERIGKPALALLAMGKFRACLLLPAALLGRLKNPVIEGFLDIVGAIARHSKPSDGSGCIPERRRTEEYHAGDPLESLTIWFSLLRANPGDCGCRCQVFTRC